MQRIKHFFHRDKDVNGKVKEKKRKHKEDTNFTMKVLHHMDVHEDSTNYNSLSLNMQCYVCHDSDEIVKKFNEAVHQCSPAGEAEYQQQLAQQFEAMMPSSSMMQPSHRAVTSRRSEFYVFGKIKGVQISGVEFSSLDDLADFLRKHHINIKFDVIKTVENASPPRLR